MDPPPPPPPPPPPEPTTPAGNESISGNDTGMYWNSNRYVPIYVHTVFWALIFIFLPFAFWKNENRALIRTMIMISSVCCWLFAVTIYIAQLNPLVGPRVSNHTYVWLARQVLESSSGNST